MTSAEWINKYEEALQTRETEDAEIARDKEIAKQIFTFSDVQTALIKTV